ncbi:MAG: hypothetical protein SFZ24_08415, partial [Planctomycetota bacterium]|nr:hypothetical protein [Planctomycetota bacterium]MDX2115626.1 hypothetical protein [Planctomycetota bacterium]
MNAAQTPSLDTLLTYYLDATMTIADVAFCLSRTITETLDLLESPDFIALRERYAAAQERRAATAA